MAQSPGSTPRRTSRRVLGAILLVIVVGVVELLSFATLRVLGLDRGLRRANRHLYNPYRGHELNPDFKSADTGNDRLHSSDGFRAGRVLPVEKPAGEYRIFLLGGSAAYGLGADAPYPRHASLRTDETIDHFLEERLNRELSPKTGKRYTVTNAAVVAYHTFQHVVHVNERLYRYSPDLLVFLDGHNDYYLCNPDYNPLLDYQYSSPQLVRSMNEGRPSFGLYGLAHALAPYSNTLTVVDAVAKKLWEKNAVVFDDSVTHRCGGEDPAQYKATAKNTYVRSYVQIAALGALYGFKMAVFLQPEVVFEDPERLSPGDEQIRALTEKLEGAGAERRRRIHAIIPSVFAEKLPSIPFTDVSAPGSYSDKAGGDLYLDYCHLSARGSAVVAEKMFPVIRSIATGETTQAGAQ